MKKRIFHSVIAVAMTVLFASLLIATAFLYNYFNKSQAQQLKNTLDLVSATVHSAEDARLNELDNSVYRFTLIDTDGSVIYDTQVNFSEMENHSDREEIKEAFNKGNGSSVRYSSTLTEKTLYEAKKLDDGTVLRVSTSQKTVTALLLSMLPVICAVVLIAALVSLFLAKETARRITEPLEKLDLEHPVDNDVYEELTPVLTKLNQQHKQIIRQINELRQKTDEFEKIISSMKEGLILLNKDEKILSLNKAAAEMFYCNENEIGNDFLTVDRTPEMRRAINGALSNGHSEFTAERNGIQYRFSLDSIESGEQTLGIVILGFDITDKVFAERNRREFTANVTHELKTPLQSILGSAELLENGLVKPEDTGRFIGNIKKEASRLVILINDIIRLSQLDENAEMAIETVELSEVANEVVNVLSDSAEKKNVTLSVVSEPCTIQGIRRYIYEIIYNLCDNAIRYNVENGSVEISIKKENGRSVICVSDTGIGIPPEHHSRIFERFYRVDKSHSKENGGTGLGLSIVYHAVRYHGGKVELSSEVGKGTKVKIII